MLIMQRRPKLVRAGAAGGCGVGPRVEIADVISLFGFMNRWNDSMATPLEAEPIEVGERFLAGHGGSPARHLA